VYIILVSYPIPNLRNTLPFLFPSKIFQLPFNSFWTKHIDFNATKKKIQNNKNKRSDATISLKVSVKKKIKHCTQEETVTAKQKQKRSCCWLPLSLSHWTGISTNLQRIDSAHASPRERVFNSIQSLYNSLANIFYTCQPNGIIIKQYIKDDQNPPINNKYINRR
jgi:hypothetical protein